MKASDNAKIARRRNLVTGDRDLGNGGRSTSNTMWDWFKELDEIWSAAGSYGLAALSWMMLLCSMALGLVGVVVPVIPGAIVMLGGAIVFNLLTPGWLNWWSVIALAVLVVLDRVADFAGTAAGTKWFGGTKWGIFGAIVGGVVGLFFGPLGLVLGPVAGAVLFELVWAKRNPKEAARSGVGAGVGFGLSMAGRFVICLIMMAIVAVDLVVG